MNLKIPPHPALIRAGLALAAIVALALISRAQPGHNALSEEALAEYPVGSQSIILASTAPTSTHLITVTLQGPQPALVTIHAGDAITWKNVSGLPQTLRLVQQSRAFIPVVARGDPGTAHAAMPPTDVESLAVHSDPIEQVLGVDESFSYVFGAAGNFVFSVSEHNGSIIVLPGEIPQATPTPTLAPTPTPTSTGAPKYMVVAAGDIASCSNGLVGAYGTASLIGAMPEAQVLALGDLAYGEGTAAQFQACYGPTWGPFKNRTRPSPGNHEYRTPGAAGYFGYFGVPEYYSWDFAGWHFVSLDSEIDYSPASAQMNWLRADLAANGTRCTLAYWHRPRFSSGSTHGPNPSLNAIWSVLQADGVSVVLNGHEHNYERFGPQDLNGNADAKGIRQFVVGTGGVGFYGFSSTPMPNSQFRLANVYGVLTLELLPSAYRWEFIAMDGTVKDSGTANCN